MKTNLIALAVAALCGASAASAATVTEAFKLTTSISGTYYETLTFTGDKGNTVEMTMGTYGGDLRTGTEGGGLIGQWTGYGAGVCTGKLSYYGCKYDNHYVDGYGANEFLQFSFDSAVTLESIVFRDYGDNFFDLAMGNGDLYEDLRYNDFGVFSGVSLEAGESFRIGASNGRSGFKVQQFRVAYDDTPPPPAVPLPAAGWMLLAGLGGLAATKRRKG